MLHKISQLCDKIDGLKIQADRLRDAKYGPQKSDAVTIQNMIETSGCSTICQYDYGKCEKKIETNNPAFTILRVINGVYGQ